MAETSKKPVSVGIIGYGFIGRDIARRIASVPVLFSLAFVHCRNRAKAADIPDTKFLSALENFEDHNPDIIIEAAHPSVTENFGAAFLKQCNYLPLSTGALIDAHLLETLRSTAKEHGSKLYLAAGALVGGSELNKKSSGWKKARITFKKNPDNIDFADVDLSPENIVEETEIYRGPVRDIARKFPRNVNTMVTTALLSTGIDKCEGVLVADPGLDCAIAIVEAWGNDGGYIRTEKRQPAIGVSGTEMTDSAWYSLLRASHQTQDATEFV